MQPFFGGEELTESELRLTEAPLVNTERTDWMWRAFLPVGSDRDNGAVNVFGPNSVDISGMKFPATILFIGGFDPLQDWQRRYREGLEKNGKEVYSIEYPNAFHSFYVFPNLNESSMLIREVRNFIQKQSAFN
uniref:Alpha/beta hydrolase fold-3 domain-containing protein n=1 Tax=Davidia involucrata TaxID=16924 RepID=A0A5B6YMS2_DAVIN